MNEMLINLGSVGEKRGGPLRRKMKTINQALNLTPKCTNGKLLKIAVY